MHPRNKKNLFIAMTSLVLCVISIYFGMSVFNASHNEHVQHLNEADKIFYYDKEMIPSLNFRAAIFTIPFILGILILSLLVYRATNVRQPKNLALGSIVAIVVVIIFDVIVLSNPYWFDFSKWGFVWVTMGAIIIWANVLSIFIREK